MKSECRYTPEVHNLRVLKQPQATERLLPITYSALVSPLPSRRPPSSLHAFGNLPCTILYPSRGIG